jgi:hypothetical protein
MEGWIEIKIEKYALDIINVLKPTNVDDNI